jgi:hypothetical protein
MKAYSTVIGVVSQTELYSEDKYNLRPSGRQNELPGNSHDTSISKPRQD